MRISTSTFATTIACMLFAACESKHVYGTFRLSRDQYWAELGKFSYSKGIGTVRGNFSTSGYQQHKDGFNPNEGPKLLLILDSHLELAKAALTCDDFSSHALSTHVLNSHVIDRDVPHEGFMPANLVPYNDPPRNTVFLYNAGSIQNVMRPHYWYLYVIDCHLDEPDPEATPETLDPLFYYSINFMNPSGAPHQNTEGVSPYSHIPTDQEGMRHALASCLVFLLAFGSLFIVLASKHMASQGTLHMVLVLLGGAMVLQTVFVVCELMHLIKYTEDGRGYKLRDTWFALDMVGESAQSLAQLILSVVLVALSCGWTITSGSLEAALPSSTSFERAHLDALQRLRRPSTLFDSWNPTSIFLSALTVMHVVLVFWSLANGSDFDQFHNHQHWSGRVLLLSRLCLFVLFASAGSRLWRTVGPEAKAPLLGIGILGTVYFMGFPVILLIGELIVAEYVRHRFVMVGVLTIQTFAMVALAYMFLGQNQYANISTLRNSGSLPMAQVQKRRFSLSGKISMD